MQLVKHFCENNHHKSEYNDVCDLVHSNHDNNTSLNLYSFKEHITLYNYCEQKNE